MASKELFDALRYFDEDEFSDWRMMDPELLRQLDAARHHAGVPFKLTSTYREGDEKAHGLGKAVDIDVTDGFQRNLIVRACLKFFNRVGIYYSEHEGHVHVDVATASEGFPQNVIWAGESK